jgi:hypothetical protein
MTITARSSSALTCTLASLATSSGLTVGRCSSAYDNSTNRDENLSISGLITTGTTPTIGTVIEMWAFGERADGTWPELFTAAYTGSDGGFTIQDRNVLFGGAALVASLRNQVATSNLGYVIRPRDICELLTAYTSKFALFVTHSTGVNLNSTGGNHVLTVKPSYWA